MKHSSGNTYWEKLINITNFYPYLKENTNCDILIIGGGITGAITAYFLSKLNLNIIICEKDIVGMNSTKASTALLEYQIDNLLIDLKKNIGNEANKCYDNCLDATYSIENISKEINCSYKRVNTILYTNKKKNYKIIKKEYLERKSNGFDCLIEYNKNNMKYILKTNNSSIIINPYEFTTKLYKYLNEKINIKVYENTNIEYTKSNKNNIISYTDNNYQIKSNYVIYTTGYDFKNTNIKNISITKTFAIVTNQMDESFIKNYTGKDMNNPYHYLRFTDDNRIIFGGEDILYKNKLDNKKCLDKIAKQKYTKLLKELKKIFNNNLKIDYSFNGTFINTKDTLPFIDEVNKNIFCNLGYGANGILYSVIGAKEIFKRIKSNKKLSTIYKIDR